MKVRLRNLLILVVLAGVGYWYYKDRPTLSEFVDDLTRPLMGSRAAVKESEHSRVVGDAATVIAVQSDEPVSALRVGMTMAEVRELLGNPDKSETLNSREPVRVRWTFRPARRILIFEDGQVASIAIL